jgi:NADPH:quinone reductase-like Zn-dependent oxidoreductase
LQPGQSLAVTGATGGVGHLLVQLAMHAGIKVTAVANSQRGFDWLQNSDLKPDAIVSAKEYPFEEAFDALVDTVGGDLLGHLLENVVPMAQFSFWALPPGQVASIDTTILVSRGIDLISYKDYSPAGEDLSTLLTLVSRRSSKFTRIILAIGIKSLNRISCSFSLPAKSPSTYLRTKLNSYSPQ